jgi:cell division transport system ATP-binding protein
MIELVSVSKAYPGSIDVLYNIDLHVGKDEFAFMVGPSGAGKTTIMKLLYREEIPTSGKVLVDRVNVVELDSSQVPYLRRNIGVVFQDYKLLNKRTIYENVAFALRVTGTPRASIRRKVMQSLELVGLLRKANAFPEELSGGEKQRACIARAIVNNPPILLADEPTGNLDPATSWDIIQLLDKINKRNTTVLVATHNKSIVDDMKRRVVCLENGRVTRDQQLGTYTVNHSQIPNPNGSGSNACSAI